MENLRISIIGRDSRAHTLACALVNVSLVEKIAVIPGNGTTHSAGDKIWHVPIKPETENLETLVGHAKSNKIDITFIFSEDLIKRGIIGLFRQAGKEIIDLTQKIIRPEAEITLAKEFMQRYEALFSDFEIIKNPA